MILARGPGTLFRPVYTRTVMGGGGSDGSRLTFDVLAGARDLEREGEELRRLLGERPRSIPSHYFYDGRGSRLFDQITRLPEYYLTRAEAEILEREADHIIARAGAFELMELGSGMSTKTRILLDAMERADHLHRYIPFDVSEPAVRDAAGALARAYPELRIHGVVGEFDRHLAAIPPGERRLVMLIGSTIGNFEREPARQLLRRIAEPMAAGDWFLLGADLVKDPAILEAAYNDSRGVTAEFNLNILSVVNEAFDGDFPTELYRHRAFYDRKRERIEMRLVADRAHRVELAGLGLNLEIAAGEEIRTEISCKYRREVIEELLAGSGFGLADWLTDGEELFGLALARREG